MNFTGGRGKYSARDVDDESDLQPLKGVGRGGVNGSQHMGTLGVERTVGLGNSQSKFRVNWANIAIGLLLVISVGLIITLAKCNSGKETDQQIINSQEGGSLVTSFLVVGDWGRQGDFNQSEVAQAMAAVAENWKPNFVISTGDNFYPHGLNSTKDENFDLSFRGVYVGDSLSVPWYAVLGNHDYGDGSDDADECLKMDGGCPRSPLYQLDVDLNKFDSRWHCSRLYGLSLDNGTLDLFFMDTSPFINSYRSELWANYKGGLKQQSWEAQLLELEAMLARSGAPWKLLVAHHPVRSNGEHGDTQEMVKHVQPLLEKYNVRVALHGHDHDLEHIHKAKNPVHYIVSGAGSKTREMNGTKDAVFQYDKSGFVLAALKKEELVLEFYGIEKPIPLYKATIPRQMNESGW